MSDMLAMGAFEHGKTPAGASRPCGDPSFRMHAIFGVRTTSFTRPYPVFQFLTDKPDSASA